MMIRINLLPVRQVKKREMGRRVLVLAAGVLVLTAAGNYVWYDGLEEDRTELQAKVNDTNRRIAELEKVIGEVNEIRRRQQEVEDKLKVLDELKKSRGGPVRMLDALATAIPKYVSLRDFTEQDNRVTINGAAKSHDDVAEFMRSLNTIVWTPRGIARIVEQRRGATTARVELLNPEGTLQDFPTAEISAFFTNIELKQATAQGAGGAAGVSFEIQLSTNYAT